MTLLDIIQQAAATPQRSQVVGQGPDLGQYLRGYAPDPRVLFGPGYGKSRVVGQDFSGALERTLRPILPGGSRANGAMAGAMAGANIGSWQPMQYGPFFGNDWSGMHAALAARRPGAAGAMGPAMPMTPRRTIGVTQETLADLLRAGAGGGLGGALGGGY